MTDRLDQLLTSISGRSRRAVVAGCDFHFIEAGEGPTVLLLHGMPAFWYSWRAQLRALVSAGYRVIVPDLPGYNRTGKLRGTAAYDDGRVLEYLTAFIQHVAAGPVQVIGHDRGGWLAWMLAMHRPALVERLVVIGVPHPHRMRENLYRWRQVKRSWYVYLILIPGVMEIVFRIFNFAALRHAIAANRIGETIDAEDVALYVEAAREPGALTGMLSYYRANSRAVLRKDPLWWAPALPAISAPTLVAWPTADPYVDPSLATPYSEDVPDLRVVELEGGHWLHEENPHALNAELLGFLANPRTVQRCGSTGPREFL